MDNPDTVYVTLRNTTVRNSLHGKHLGNFISNNIYDRNIKEHVCRFIGKINAILCDFGCCDSSTLVNIHRTFCMDLYGCELWNISSKYTEEMHTERSGNYILVLTTIWFVILDQILHIPWKKDIFLSCIMPCITLMNWSDYYYMLS